MSFHSWSGTRALRRVIGSLAIAACLLLIVDGARVTTAQETKAGPAAKGGDNAALIARGKYIVTGVAACGNCHTPRTQSGGLDYSRWLAGGPVPYLSARPESDWPILCPRIGGLPPASDAQMITLLTTGIWDNG